MCICWHYTVLPACTTQYRSTDKPSDTWRQRGRGGVDNYNVHMEVMLSWVSNTEAISVTGEVWVHNNNPSTWRFLEEPKVCLHFCSAAHLCDKSRCLLWEGPVKSSLPLSSSGEGYDVVVRAPYELPSPSEPTEGGSSPRHDVKQHVVHETMPWSASGRGHFAPLSLAPGTVQITATTTWFVTNEHVCLLIDLGSLDFFGLCEIKPCNSSTGSNQSKGAIGAKVSISVLYFAEQGLAHLHFEVCVLLSVSLISLFSPSSWLWRQINRGMGSGWIYFPFLGYGEQVPCVIWYFCLTIHVSLLLWYPLLLYY